MTPTRSCVGFKNLPQRLEDVWTLIYSVHHESGYVDFYTEVGFVFMSPADVARRMVMTAKRESVTKHIDMRPYAAVNFAVDKGQSLSHDVV